MPTLNSPFAVAAFRGILSAIVTGGIALLSTYQVTNSWSDAAVVGGLAFLTTIGARVGVEGTIDQKRSGS